MFEVRGKQWHNESIAWHGTLCLSVPFEYIRKQFEAASDKSMPSIGAFWPVWNEEDFLEASLNSLKDILAQAVILIDKKTTDKTPEIAEKFKSEVDFPVEIIRCKEAYSLEIIESMGINKMTTDWWLQVHGDEIWLPEQAQNLKLLCATNPCGYPGYRYCGVDLLTPFKSPKMYAVKRVFYASRLYKNHLGIIYNGKYPNEAPCFADGTPVCHYVPRILNLWFYHVPIFRKKETFLEKAKFYSAAYYRDEPEEIREKQIRASWEADVKSATDEVELQRRISEGILLEEFEEQRRGLEKWL